MTKKYLVKESAKHYEGGGFQSYTHQCMTKDHAERVMDNLQNDLEKMKSDGSIIAYKVEMIIRITG